MEIDTAPRGAAVKLAVEVCATDDSGISAPNGGGSIIGIAIARTASVDAVA